MNAGSLLPSGTLAASDVQGTIDARKLDSLKRQARERPETAAREAARQFEAMFLQMLMKSMRDALPGTDAMMGESGKLYTGMLDGEWAQRLSGKGIGLAAALERQLTRQGTVAGAAQAGPPGPVKATAPGARSLPVQGPGIPDPAGVDKANRGPAPGDPRAFLDQMLPHAREAGRSLGVNPKFVLGQAALESGWGAREIRGSDGASSHNLFGIKAGPGWTGRTVTAMTTEYVNGVPQKVAQNFRAYDSYADAFRDWSRLVGSSPRYAAARGAGSDVSRFAQGLAAGGYATDPAYADKLTRVINSRLLTAQVSAQGAGAKGIG